MGCRSHATSLACWGEHALRFRGTFGPPCGLGTILGWAGDAGHGEVVGGEFEDDLLALLERIGERGVGGEVGDDLLAIGEEGDPCAAVWA